MPSKKPKKSPKKPAAKSGSKPSTTPGAIVPTKTLEFAPKSYRRRTYTTLFDDLTRTAEKAKATGTSQTLLVPVPAGVSSRVFHNRLNSAVRNRPPVLPKGFVLWKQVTKDGKAIGISISPEEK